MSSIQRGRKLPGTPKQISQPSTPRDKEPTPKKQPKHHVTRRVTTGDHGGQRGRVRRGRARLGLEAL